MSRSSMLRAACATVIAGCLVSSVVRAEPGDKDGAKRPDPARIFKKRDADGDGKLSLTEFKTGMPEKALARADARFKKLDTDGDGGISLAEFTAGMQQRPKKPA